MAESISSDRPGLDWISPVSYTHLVGSDFLFDTYYIPSAREDYTNLRSLRLSFQEGDLPCLAAGLQVMAINPNSKHIDEAIALLQ